MIHLIEGDLHREGRGWEGRGGEARLTAVHVHLQKVNASVGRAPPAPVPDVPRLRRRKNPSNALCRLWWPILWPRLVHNIFLSSKCPCC